MIKGEKEIKLALLKFSRLKNPDYFGVEKIKREIAKAAKIPPPSNAELLKSYHSLVKNKRILENENLKNLLVKKRIRSASGIVNVSVLTKPYPCPGKCIYCPTEKGLPKSYLSLEPAVQRAVAAKFDPYLQVKARILSLKNTGHLTDKIELRTIGGTWSFYPKKYQEWFTKRCFDACNSQTSKNLEKAQEQNEKTKNRIIGISVETRPDYINKPEIKQLRKFGVTRVELGVQCLDDDILELNKRGNGIKEIIEATKLLKDAGFKVSYQMMPNLPGSSFKKDVKMFREMFSNPDYKPDLLKIYPLAFVAKPELKKMKNQGKLKIYGGKELLKLIIEIKKLTPFWCRIERIIRDIPPKKIIEGGAKILNLRDLAQKEMEKMGLKCRCIRCREVRENYNPKEKLVLFREDYESAGGKEIFLSWEDKKREKIYSLLRLRIPSQTLSKEKHFISCLNNAGIIREAHTFGKVQPIKKNSDSTSPQHKGLGKKLIETAEKIVKQEFGLSKIAVISGVGVRGYYRKLGYKLEDTYMVKKL